MRHQRKKALKNADLVLLAGMPCDFRLGYVRSFGAGAGIISINRSKADLKLNCRPDLAVLSDPFLFLCALADVLAAEFSAWGPWIQELKKNDDGRVEFISKTAREKTDFLNPLLLLQKLKDVSYEKSMIVADGGALVGPAAYI